MSIGEVVRSKEEIVELTQEIREHLEAHSQQFVDFTFEEGVQATIKWLFYQNEKIPTELTKPRTLRYTADD